MLDLTLSMAGCDVLHLQAGNWDNLLYEGSETTWATTDEHQGRVGCYGHKLRKKERGEY